MSPSLLRSALLSACIAVTTAAEPPVPAVTASTPTLAELVNRVAARDPALATSATAITVAQAQARAAGRWEAPNLELDIRRSDGPDDDEMAYEVTFMQPLPLGSGRRGAIAAGHATSAVRQADADAATVDLLARVRSDLIALERAAHHLAVASADLSEAQALATSSEQQRAAGLLTETDRLRIAAEVASAEHAVVLARSAQVAIAASTTRRLGAVLPHPHGVDLAFHPVPERSTLATALSAHPQLRAAEHAITVATAQLRAAQAQRWPGVAVGVVAGRAGDVDEVGVIVDLRLPVWDGRRDLATAASAEVRQAQAAHAQRARDLLDAAEAAWDAWQQADLHVRSIRTALLPTAEQLAERSREAYARGDLPVTEAISARRLLLQMRLAVHHASADLAQAHTDLERHLGFTAGLSP